LRAVQPGYVDQQGPAQSSEASEVAVEGAEFGVVLDSQRRVGPTPPSCANEDSIQLPATSC
jgi:hypothetical protein